jgi:hypothetical protein
MGVFVFMPVPASICYDYSMEAMILKGLVNKSLVDYSIVL